MSISPDPIELSQEETRWNLFQRVAFRFFFVYFLFVIVFENNGAFPFWYYVDELLKPLTDFFLWVGKNVLGITWEIGVTPTGSGDTTLDFIRYFCALAIGAISALVWSVLDRKRNNYNKLYYWLTVTIRYYVAFMLFTYGMIKIFKLQFPYPDLYRLSEPYGHSTPMGLAWTFFGFSKGYNWFVGIAELCALLMLFRRTLTFGTLLTLITSLNILAVNLFFDVPVKLLSLTLVMMCLFLLAHDVKRLYLFFFTDKTTVLQKIAAPVLPKKWMKITKHVIKAALILYVVGWGGYQMSSIQSRDDIRKPKLYGVYEIYDHEFVADSTHAVSNRLFPWKQVVISSMDRVVVRMVNDSTGFFQLRLSNPDSTMSFITKDPEQPDKKEIFRFNISDSSNIILRGRMYGDSVRFVLHKTAGADSIYTLRKTGFHWISDKPNNR